MPAPSSPTVWRRWLAFELTRLRKEAGLGQKEVADRLRCTVTKVSYLEKAERPVVLRDLPEVLLPLYGVPEERWPVYLEAAKHSRRKGWWESYHPGAVAPWFSLYMGLEQGASQIRTYQAQGIPGLLQTDEYARTLLTGEWGVEAEERIEKTVQARSARQEVLTRQDQPLAYHVVLDEASIRRQVGDVKLMQRQLRHLSETARLPNVDLRVLPFSAGAHPGMTCTFSVLGFPWETDPGVVYIEVRSGAFYLETREEVDVHVVAFRRLSNLALSPEDSLATIAEAAKGFSHE